MELLISIAILAMGSVLLTQSLARGAHALGIAHQQSTAYAFASAKLADVELGLRQGAELKPSGEFGTGSGRFEWHLDRAAADAPQLELVTLTVGWRQGRHQYESKFSTLHRLPGPDLR